MKTSIKQVAKLMKKLDYCIFTTVTARGALASRPMSNNRQVDFDGDAYFFTWEDSRLVEDIREHSNQVHLGFNADDDIFISVGGKAKVVTRKSVMTEHWTSDLDRWFEDGVDTEGVVMIHVAAKHVKVWAKGEETELSL